MHGADHRAVQIHRIAGQTLDSLEVVRVGNDHADSSIMTGRFDLVNVEGQQLVALFHPVAFLDEAVKAVTVHLNGVHALSLIHISQAVLLADTEHCGFFHSMIGVEGILEYLLILMCWAQPESFRAKLQQRDAILAEYREDKN